MKIICLICGLLFLWVFLGGCAFFHARKRDKVKYNIDSGKPFIKDPWFYDSLFNGLRAFYFEFLDC